MSILDQYRLLKIRSVRITKDSKDFAVNFYGSYVGMCLNRALLQEKWNITNIKEGDEFFIKGSAGNSDIELASPDDISDIRKA